MKHSLRGLLAVILFGGVLYVGWIRYHDFLTVGMRPPEGTQILNQMEKSGVLDFSMADINGKEIKLSNFKDKTVILSFWASWCDPCVAEFPSMLKLVDFFKGQVVMIAVSADYELDDINKFLKTFGGANSPNVYVLWDKDKKIADLYGTEALPEAFILGKGLKLIRKVAGSEDWFAPGAVQLFHEIVNTPAEANK